MRPGGSSSLREPPKQFLNVPSDERARRSPWKVPQSFCDWPGEPALTRAVFHLNNAMFQEDFIRAIIS